MNPAPVCALLAGFLATTRPAVRGLIGPQQEHLPLIAAFARSGPLNPVDLRRNLVVSGINLLSLKNARLRVGDALIQLVGPCAPCSRMEEVIGPGGYAAMRGHGGMTARILEGGAIRVGDAVSMAPPAA